MEDQISRDPPKYVYDILEVAKIVYQKYNVVIYEPTQKPEYTVDSYVGIKLPKVKLKPEYIDNLQYRWASSVGFLICEESTHTRYGISLTDYKYQIMAHELGT